MTTKRRRTITDDYGVHIASVYVAPDAEGFENASIAGLHASHIKTLRNANFRGAELYEAILTGSDLSGCNFERSDLRGANLQKTRLVGANFRGASAGVDNIMLPTRFQGADLTDAILDGADLKGAEYDAATVFPGGFDPGAAGMVETDDV